MLQNINAGNNSFSPAFLSAVNKLCYGLKEKKQCNGLGVNSSPSLPTDKYVAVLPIYSCTCWMF